MGVIFAALGVLAKPWIASRSSISMVQPIVFQSRCCSGLAFAWMTTKLARRIYQHRMETSARITLIRDRNSKIRRAVKAITPVPYPKNQQAIRVIRKEADRIEGALTAINASAAASRSCTRRPKT
jgi:NADH:ubiquinone oxidoreductase subunit D